MNSLQILGCSKVFIIGSWLNIIPGFVAYFLGNSHIMLLSYILFFVCVACAIIFYFIYRHVSDKEDWEIIKQMDEEFNKNKNDKTLS